MSLHLSFSWAAQVMEVMEAKLGPEEFKRRLPYNLEGRSVSQVGRRVILGLSWVDYRGQERGF